MYVEEHRKQLHLVLKCVLDVLKPLDLQWTRRTLIQSLKQLAEVIWGESDHVSFVV